MRTAKSGYTKVSSVTLSFIPLIFERILIGCDPDLRAQSATYAGKWECMGTFSAEAPREDAGDEAEDAMVQE